MNLAFIEGQFIFLESILLSTSPYENHPIRYGIDFSQTEPINWSYIVNCSSGTSVFSNCEIYNAISLVDNSDTNILYLLESYTHLNQSLLSVVNMTYGQYISSRVTLDSFTQCYRMLNYNVSIIILCDTGTQSALLQYIKMSTTLEVFFKFSTEIKILDIADVYIIDDTKRLLCVGEGSHSPSAYISKTLVNYADVHKDIYAEYNASVSSSTTNFEISSYTPTYSFYANDNVASDIISQYSFSDLEVDMIGAYVVAVYKSSSSINNLFYGTPQTYSIDFTCLIDPSLATISYELMGPDNEVVDWVVFDPSTSQITITPPYYSQDTIVNVTLRSRVDYSSSKYESSDSQIDKPIILNIMAAGS